MELIYIFGGFYSKTAVLTGLGLMIALHLYLFYITGKEVK